MQDLKGFSPAARNLITDATNRGWEVNVSNRGHAIMRWPYGGTAAISRDLGGSRRLRNAKADLGRVEREHPAPEPEWTTWIRSDGTPNPAVETTGSRYRCATCENEYHTGRGASKHSTQSHGKVASAPPPAGEVEAEQPVAAPEPQPQLDLLDLVKSDLVRDLVLERERSAKILDNLAAVRDLISELLAEFS